MFLNFISSAVGFLKNAFFIIFSIIIGIIILYILYKVMPHAFSFAKYIFNTHRNVVIGVLITIIVLRIIVRIINRIAIKIGSKNEKNLKHFLITQCSHLGEIDLDKFIESELFKQYKELFYEQPVRSIVEEFVKKTQSVMVDKIINDVQEFMINEGMSDCNGIMRAEENILKSTHFVSGERVVIAVIDHLIKQNKIERIPIGGMLMSENSVGIADSYGSEGIFKWVDATSGNSFISEEIFVD